jgi:hypothetical protein
MSVEPRFVGAQGSEAKTMIESDCKSELSKEEGRREYSPPSTQPQNQRQFELARVRERGEDGRREFIDALT